MNRLDQSGPTSGGSSSDDSAASAPAPDNMITVALIEDNRLVREGITAVLEGFGDIRVFASKTNGHLELIEEAQPEVVLLDVGLEDDDSLEVAREIIEDFPEVGIIVMDLLPAADDLVEYISLGVSGFLMKDAPLDEVARTIRTVASGSDVLPEAMTATLFSEIAKHAAPAGGTRHHDAVQLTPREKEVIDLIAEGMSNKAVAGELYISIHTVKSHLRNIMEKLNLHSRLQLARWVDDREEDHSESEQHPEP